MKKTSTLNYDLKAALEELEPDPMKDSDEMFQLKKNIEKLNSVDRTLLLLYVELASMSKVGRVLNVSPSTVYIYIKRIREQLCQGLNSL